MRTGSLRRFTWAVLAASAALAATGCSVIGGDSGDKPGPTYNDAMAVIYKDALSSMKTTTGRDELEEYGGSRDACGGPDFLDSKDDSKRRASLYIKYPGDPADKRSSADLVKAMVDQLTKLGWIVERTVPAADGPDPEVKAYMKKPGSGNAGIYSEAAHLPTGETVHDLVIDIGTDCLRNPDWRKP
ncbi:hypothetical protein J7F03_30500 [Streptomyces sp. ISL-43]|uniref:hypothetical protein n=1 Tax=Streptomyces sp. ISL-43 TaxID=2819183 RepID=UPI001BEBEFDA|nr:hypothetical protein [Streptomyces sp. ISL-43]MBT2451325.1 hypothetical protein [Streptomyces sp. ISL-43]